MRSMRHILVAVKDPGKKSNPAVTKAAQLAHAFGASLELYHSIATPLYIDAYGAVNRGLTETEQGIQAKALAQLQVIAKGLRRHGLQISVSAQWDFPAYEAVIRRADQIKADLIVAQRHAGRHTGAGLLHLTDWELLRLSPIPVLLVKTGGRYRHPVVLAAVDPAHAHAKPARLDTRIVQAASRVTKALQGTLHAVHAYLPAPAVVPIDYATARALPRLIAQVTRKARQNLDGALGSAKIPRSRRHLIGRHPIDAIEQVARQVHSSLVVMGAISRSGLKRVFIGNTAERVIDQLTCDVLVVKPAHFQSKVARAARGVHLVAYASAPFPY